MQAVVKTPHIEINVKGKIPKKLLAFLKEQYGERVQLSEEANEEMVDIFETEWYKKTKSRTTPADNLKLYRELHHLTQEKLGAMLGGIPRQHVSNMERGIRAISTKTAQRLSKIFEISVEKFL